MSENNLKTIVRIAAGVMAILLWVVSNVFSIDGFGIKVPDMLWIGIILALSVTVIELVFSQEGFNHSYGLILAGVLAYGYGIYTNFIGLQAAQITDEIIFPLGLAIFLEWIPEYLLVWALTGEVIKTFLGKANAFRSNRLPTRPQIEHPGFVTSPSGRKVPLPPRQ